MNKCIVENCDNTGEITFPTNEEEKSKWISSLQLKKDPNENSFVCLDHFKECNLNYNCNEGNNLLDKSRKEEVHYITNERNDQDELESEQTEVPKSVCRVCAKEENLEKSIYDSINNEIIMTMIMLCCHPITITENDGLPKMICSSCLQQLDSSYKFRNKCLEVNEMWLSQEKVAKKRKKEIGINMTRKKQCIENVLSSNVEKNCDSENVVCETNNAFLNIKPEKCKSQTEIIISNEPPPLIPIERHGNHDNSIKQAKFDEIEKNLEEIHKCNQEPNVKISYLKKLDEQIPSTSKKQVIKQKNDSKVGLPKDIIVTTQKKFESSVGVHSCVLTHGLQESVFVMADEYLFTFGLLKGNTRHLQCVLPNCKAKAEQKLLDINSYEDKITVKLPHNHRAPNEQLRKKHMFFHVMRKRMQHDKTLNIRNIYEQVCIQEPEIRDLVPLRNVINEICRHQVSNKLPRSTSFADFYNKIENECYEKLHFTNSNKQFYQERFQTDDGCMAVVFCNTDVIESVSQSTLMYVDASFKIDTFENFKYQLVTVLVWTDESYYPILFALVNKRTQEIFRKIFQHLHDVLAPTLRPHEIVTDYEANLYYSLGETYLESHIGGSVFYYTQNLYKKICSLNLSRDLETNSNFRNLYHMLLMLPLLPVNTIADALNNIELQAKEMRLSKLTKPIFDHIRSQWILNVTPEMFCVHRLENRINENVIAPFKKFRDYLLLFKGKVNQTQITIGQVVEKLIELESFLHEVYNKSDKKSFGRDLSSFQKKNVIRAWQYIETHPKININNFFQKVLGYIKCMENQLWIWGFYRYVGDADDVLISAANSSLYLSENCQGEEVEEEQECDEVEDNEATIEYMNEECQNSTLNEDIGDNPTIVMEAVIDNDGEVVLQSNNMLSNSKFEKTFFKYVRYE